MQEELERSYSGAVLELNRVRKISHFGRQYYVDCRDLAQVVSYYLGFDGDISPRRRVDLLDQVIPCAIEAVRVRALKEFKENLNRKDRASFLAAAATELLPVRTESFDEHYRQMLKMQRGDKPPTKDEIGRGSPQQRAAVWIGQSRGAITAKKIDTLLFAFVQEMERYLRQPHIRDKLLALISEEGQAVSISEAPAASLSQASAVAEVKYARPIVSELRDILIDLADQVKKRLHEEHAVDRVGRASAFPLPRKLVRDETYVDDPRNVADAWGADPGDTRWESAEVDDLAELVSAASCARLVVLGQGGAGKSTLAASLALKVLESAAHSESGPVPVIFPLSSWNPHKQSDLSVWLVEQLVAEDRSLKQAAKGKDAWAKRLVDGGYIMPILDGFDEIGAPVQSTALRSINSWAERGNSVVLLSRGEEYSNAVATSRPLTRAAVIEMQNAELSDVEEYLGRTTLLGEEWSAVFAQVRAYPESDRSVLLRSVLTTPLMAMLAGAVYDNGDGREPDDRRSPSELLDAERFPDAYVLTGYLLDAFIQVRLDPRFAVEGGSRGKAWNHDDARKWLGFLAAALVVGEAREFRWWKPGDVFDAAVEKIVMFVGLAALVGGIVAYASTDSLREAMLHPGGFLVALFAASLLYWFIASQEEPRALVWRFGSKRRDQWEASSNYEQFMASFAFPLISVFMVAGVLRSLVAAVAALAILAAVYYSTPLAHVERDSPITLLRTDRTVALLRGGSLSVLIAVWCFAAWVASGQGEYLDMIFVAAFLFVVAVLCAASTLWAMRAGSLAASGRLPWQTMRFLDDAHNRGIIRQSGGVYQFRHAALLGRLAREQINNLPGQLSYMSPVRARSLLLMSEFRSGVSDQADIELRKLIADNDDLGMAGASNSNRLLLVEVLRKKGKLEEAVEVLNGYRSSKMEVRFGDHLEIMLLRVELLAELDDFDKVQIAGGELLSEIEKQNRWYKGLARDKALAMRVRLREHPLFEVRDDS